MLSLSITIPAIAPSANELYAGMHPMVRRKLARTWHTMVGWEVKAQKLPRYSGTYPVDIECRCRFPKGEKRLDADNLYPTGKMVIDGLVEAGIIVNDSPRYVRSVRFVPERSESGKAYTVITITPAKEVQP